nr:metallophosphoesterase [uncultured Roseateles sp.]
MNFGPVLYVGDPHGCLNHVTQYANDLHASAVVLLGDIQPLRPLHLELEGILERVWFIHGNHDTDSKQDFEHLWDSKLADRNVHGRVVVLPDGTRLAGLGGVFRESVYYPGVQDSEPRYRNRIAHARLTPRQDRWRNGPALRHWSSIYPDEIDSLAEQEADVLITHEAPGYHPNGFGILDTLAQTMGVKVSVHGHHHDAIDSSSEWQRQGFKSFGVGLAGITSIDLDGIALVVVPGQDDSSRKAHHQGAYETLKAIRE